MDETLLTEKWVDSTVSGMSGKPKQLREAKAREGMRTLTVALPEELHRALALLRIDERIAINEAIRLAVREWLTRRKAARKRSRKGKAR